MIFFLEISFNFEHRSSFSSTRSWLIPFVLEIKEYQWISLHYGRPVRSLLLQLVFHWLVAVFSFARLFLCCWKENCTSSIQIVINLPGDEYYYLHKYMCKLVYKSAAYVHTSMYVCHYISTFLPTAHFSATLSNLRRRSLWRNRYYIPTHVSHAFMYVLPL